LDTIANDPDIIGNIYNFTAFLRPLYFKITSDALKTTVYAEIEKKYYSYDILQT